MQSTSDTEASPRISSSESESELGIKKQTQKRRRKCCVGCERNTPKNDVIKSGTNNAKREKNRCFFFISITNADFTHNMMLLE